MLALLQLHTGSLCWTATHMRRTIRKVEMSLGR